MSFSYVVDTSAWIEYFSATDKGLKIKQLIEQEEIATSITALLEIADKFERENRRFDVCLRFVQKRAVILPLTIELALAAAKLKKKQREKREKFSISDGVHLATAIEEGAVLLTADNDFAGLENVRLL